MIDRRKIRIAVISLISVWLLFWGLGNWLAARMHTAQRLSEEIEAVQMEDRSGDQESNRISSSRAKEIQRIAEMTNQLDYHERELYRKSRSERKFTSRLSSAEKAMFIKLTVSHTMQRLMEALDGMPPERRQHFVERGLAQIAEGRTARELEKLSQLGDDLLESVTREGLNAYFESSSAETKIELAPLMEAMNEVLQGLRSSRLKEGFE